MARLEESRSSFMGHDFLSNPESFINESLLSTALVNQDVAVLDKLNAVIRRDHKEALHEKVKILGGCSSGHEPAFASYVGEGMLTAAVQGNIFHSPSAAQILATLREIGKNHLPGVLIIIKNTIQERINFTIALHKALDEKMKVRMLVVRDDCFGDPDTAKGCLGSAGVILIAKIAGAMAEASENIDDIYGYCQSVSDYLRTCNAVLRTPLPVNECNCTEDRSGLPVRFICELGIGLQGEMPQQKLEIQTAHEMVSAMLDVILKVYIRPHVSPVSTPNTIPLIVMVNNLGSITPIEEKIITMEVVKQLRERKFIVREIYCGTFITSLDMKGFSITIGSVLEDSLINALHAPTKAYAWKNCIPQDLTDDAKKLKIPIMYENGENLIVTPTNFGGSFVLKTSHALPTIINFALDAVISSEKQLNIIDSITRDGDTGSNFLPFARYLQYEIASGKLETRQPGKILWSIGKIAETRFPGTLGALYAVGFQAAAQVFLEQPSSEHVTSRIWMDALQAAINTILKYGEVNIGDKTFVDSLNGALLSMRSLSEQILETNPLLVMSAATEGAELATGKTVRCPNEKKPFIKYPDAGAQAVATWMRAIYEGMKIKFSNND